MVEGERMNVFIAWLLLAIAGVLMFTGLIADQKQLGVCLLVVSALIALIAAVGMETAGTKEK
jgi:hypothetical protein